jgi:hypothetical protein
MGPSDRFEELSSTIQQRVQYCNTALNQSYTGDRQPTKPSVIKNCQVIRMLTAYAVTTRRTLARGWRVFVRRQAALPGTGIAASFRFMRVGDMDAATAICFCGVRYRRPGLHEAFLGCASGMVNKSGNATGQPVAE